MLSDCCCGSAAPVNIVGAPGQAGSPGAPGALVLLGQLFAYFNPIGTQSIPINALAYIVKDVVITQNTNDLLASQGGIYITNGGVGQIITPYTFAAPFIGGTWRSMPLGAAAASGQNVLVGPELYFITTIQSAVPASAYINVYGYVIA